MRERHISSWLMHCDLMLSSFPGDISSCVDLWTHFVDLKNDVAAWGTVVSHVYSFAACGPKPLFAQVSIF